MPTFNINNMQQGLAILRAADTRDAPVILQASRGARSRAGELMLRLMVQALAEMYPGVPTEMHQDHGNNAATCLSTIRHGFTFVMIHGSFFAPQYLQDLFNKQGGHMAQIRGGPVAEIERGIKMGVRKVNIDTNCRMAMAAQIHGARDGRIGNAGARPARTLRHCRPSRLDQAAVEGPDGNPRCERQPCPATAAKAA